MQNTYFIETMGCQMNERDSETIAGVLESLGLHAVDSPADARVIVLNTCAVREKPVHKVFSRLGDLRRQKRENPGTIIVVAGCVAQTSQNELRTRAPFVDLILGPRSIAGLAEAVREASGQQRVLADDAEIIPEGLPFTRAESVNAFVNVGYGCDNFCAYCIVPFARGREQSRAPEDVVAEVADAVGSGRPEVTLLGQNVNSYRGCAATGQTVSFPELLRLVDAVDGLRRLRFTTSHPKDLSPALLQAMAELPTVCEHLHLPIQSGDDEVLERMGRGYTLAHYLEIVHQARELIPGIALTTDVMVGFPGETPEQFERTLSAFEEIRYDQAFMFMYNDRPGTRAAGFPDKVDEGVKLERLQRLVELQNVISRAKNEQELGRIVEVLVEGPDDKSPGYLRGRTRTNKLVIFPSPAIPAGSFVNVLTREAFLWGFKGEPA
ncbi:MAG: tRNA (N6-isopentenyl adenosine(37)-C2)-methylthiotransferase MiaB [Armatimonadetes bacterium]|nr:tRNA (N6-isopentenyl adenosine(37)-C2)-methylthiotransferase MiaB [Armatimonadota bacterium]